MVDDFDNIIDDVAREMTSTPVDPNLARRVAARIDHVSPSSRAIWARPVLLAPLAAACALIVAVVISRNTPVDVERIAPPVASAPSRPTPTAGGPTPPKKEQGVARATARPAPVSLPPLTLPPIDVEVMKVETMDVTTLDVPPIVSAGQIEIDPIAIARIEIAPMP
jgi:hypothetical protein